MDVIPQVANFGFVAEGPKCPEPHTGNLFCRGKCSPALEKCLKGRRHPFCGKMDTPTLPNVPLEGTDPPAAAR